MYNFIASVLLSLLPSAIRIKVMRLLGARIGSRCKLGFLAVLNASEIDIGDNVMIAPFNLLHRLTRITFRDGSRMNGFNWVTGGGTGSFALGMNSAITRLHFFEASGGFSVGDNSIIAGRGSHFFTHGISSNCLDDVRPIQIGCWCYIGSSCRFVPGSGVGLGTFVGMGSVITKLYSEQYVLIAGNPARVLKKFSSNDKYFDRLYLPHDHHTSDYKGGLFH